ncbi:unnamed protein product [Leuciscus chuanchicus]
MQERLSATDYALWATKVMAQTVSGPEAPPLAHPGRDVGSGESALSQGLFGNTVEDFSMQFSAVKKKTEAIKHILPQRSLERQPDPRGPVAGRWHCPSVEWAIQEGEGAGLFALARASLTSIVEGSEFYMVIKRAISHTHNANGPPLLDGQTSNTRTRTAVDTSMSPSPRSAATGLHTASKCGKYREGWTVTSHLHSGPEEQESPLSPVTTISCESRPDAPGPGAVIQDSNPNGERSLKEQLEEVLELVHQISLPDDCRCAFLRVGLDGATHAKLSGEEALCAKVLDFSLHSDFINVEVNVTNLIRGGNRALIYRKFTAFLDVVSAAYGDLLMHTDIRWMSRGKCLERFFALRTKIPVFLEDHIKSDTAYCSKLRDPEFLCDMAFLIDMTAHLNNLSLFQTSMCIVHMNAFQCKLNFFHN